jgi:hypothetical protein
MPYFSTNISARGSKIKQMLVTNSAIATSTIDMNLQPITSLADPVQPQDAATRYYVDSSVQKVESELQSFFTGLVVELKGIAFTEVAHIKPGSYIVTITAYQDGYPTASFSISKASAYSNGHVMRMTSSFGTYTQEQLELQWPQGGVLSLRKNGPGYDGSYLVDLNVKNMSALPAPPVLPTDQASKAYVDKVVKDTLDAKFGGVQVRLNDTEYSEVAAIRPGSYIVLVIPTFDGCATASFLISKSSTSDDGNIVRITSSPATETGETLELIWPSNSKILLKKTGSFHDGLYIVDMNLKNFTNVAPPVIPSDVASKNYVDEQIKLKMQSKFSGITITLTGTDYVPLVAMATGSYILTISSTIAGGPTATFSISKSKLELEPSVVRVTASLGVNSNEDIELIWPPNDKIFIRKTGQNYNGLYIVDTSLRNMTIFSEQCVSPPVIGSTKIGQVIEYNFALYQQQETNVTYLSPGIYFAFVTFSEPGIYNATFSLSKRADDQDGFTVPLVTSGSFISNYVPDRITIPEGLKLRWSQDNILYVNKTVDEHDGIYILKIM